MPVCEGCGVSYEDQFKFCPHCGRVKPEKAQNNEEIAKVKLEVAKTNAELEIFLLRQDVENLQKEFDLNENNLGGVLVFVMFGTGGFLVGVVSICLDRTLSPGLFLILGGLLLICLAPRIYSKNRAASKKLTSAIREKEAKIQENAKNLKINN